MHQSWLNERWLDWGKSEKTNSKLVEKRISWGQSRKFLTKKKKIMAKFGCFNQNQLTNVSTNVEN